MKKRVCNHPVRDDSTEYNYDKLFQIAKSLLKYENPLVDSQLIADYSKTFNSLPRNIVYYNDDIIESTWTRMEPYLHEIANSGLDLNLDLSFGSLDEAVIWSMTRLNNPKLIVEIGAGFSTMIFNAARKKIKEENNLSIKHVAIEPYRSDVIKALGDSVDIKVNVIQQVEVKFFDRLQENDILFIDNSHVVQPYGDVIYEMLYILPRLKKGVWVHIHDIFIPHDYPPSWYKENRSYTEQYFVAAFLHKNNDWEVMFPVHYAAEFILRDVIASKGLSLGGGSLWLRKVN
ncbi:hypothetical protein PSENEW3n2_00000877 [Picochlorum sp. SENEW3]|nr:hypothetical protein PSENEW3n2_00000877 [Picochlorum sp. SENEW3]WPT15799.1 hypothetical protein PSENEW3_00000877 [Picochlorum sp. SENEW3]